MSKFLTIFQLISILVAVFLVYRALSAKFIKTSKMRIEEVTEVTQND